MNNEQKSVYGRKKLSLIDRLTIHKRLEITKKVIKNYLKEYSNKNISLLEMGCGYQGLNLIRLNKIFPNIEYQGIDLSVTNNTFQNIKLTEKNINQWQPKKKYEIVLSLAVVEHLINPIQHFYIIRQCLKPNAIALITTPTPQNHLLWSNLSRLGVIDANGEEEHKLYLTRGGIFQLARLQKLEVIEYGRFEFGLNQYAIIKHIN